jgi:hypothetical protein
METKQTALEFLFDTLDINHLISREKLTILGEAVRQAKQMEKEQIMNAFDSGYFNYEVLFYDNAEEYYNETYKQ